jgi:hypothetical protein
MMPPTSRAFALEQRQGVGRGLARVDDDGLSQVASEPNEPREDLALRVTGRVIVVIIEADLTHGSHLGSARQLA